MKDHPFKLVKKKARIPAVLALFGLMMILAGCGQTAYREGDGSVTNQTGQQNGGGNSNSSGNTGGNSGNTHGTTAVNTGNEQIATSNVSFSFKLTGDQTITQDTNGQIMRAETGSVFKVTLRTGDPLSLSGTGYTIGFNCQGYTVSVLGESHQVKVKRAGYSPMGTFDPCYGAEDAPTIDFSGRLQQGHNAVTVQISDALYDNCRLYGNPRVGGCTMSSVHHPSGYTPHQIQGRLEITTNSLN